MGATLRKLSPFRAPKAPPADGWESKISVRFLLGDHDGSHNGKPFLAASFPRFDSRLRLKYLIIDKGGSVSGPKTKRNNFWINSPVRILTMVIVDFCFRVP